MANLNEAANQLLAVGRQLASEFEVDVREVDQIPATAFEALTGRRIQGSQHKLHTRARAFLDYELSNSELQFASSDQPTVAVGNESDSAGSVSDLTR